MGGEFRGCQWRTKYATDHQRSKRGKLVREKGHHPGLDIILERGPFFGILDATVGDEICDRRPVSQHHELTGVTM